MTEKMSASERRRAVLANAPQPRLSAHDEDSLIDLSLPTDHAPAQPSKASLFIHNMLPNKKPTSSSPSGHKSRQVEKARLFEQIAARRSTQHGNRHARYKQMMRMDEEVQSDDEEEDFDDEEEDEEKENGVADELKYDVVDAGGDESDDGQSDASDSTSGTKEESEDDIKNDCDDDVKEESDADETLDETADTGEGESDNDVAQMRPHTSLSPIKDASFVRPADASTAFNSTAIMRESSEMATPSRGHHAPFGDLVMSPVLDDVGRRAKGALEGMPTTLDDMLREGITDRQSQPYNDTLAMMSGRFPSQLPEETSTASDDAFSRTDTRVAPLFRLDSAEPPSRKKRVIERVRKIERDPERAARAAAFGDEDDDLPISPPRQIKESDGFLDEEADGESGGENDDEEEGDDKYEDEAGDADVMPDNLNDQLGRIHAKLKDQDERAELDALKESYFVDADLMGDDRRFQWKSVVTESYAVDLGTLHTADVEEENAEDVVADELAKERLERVKATRASSSVDKPAVHDDSSSMGGASSSQSLFQLSMQSRHSSRPSATSTQEKVVISSMLGGGSMMADDEDARQPWSFMSRSTHLEGAASDRRADPSKGLYRDTSKAPDAKRARQTKPTAVGDSSSRSLFDLIEKR